MCFETRLKEDSDSDSLMSSGRLFQILGALMAKALSPLVSILDSGTDRRPLPTSTYPHRLT